MGENYRAISATSSLPKIQDKLHWEGAILSVNLLTSGFSKLLKKKGGEGIGVDCIP
jgi:hypothetical protein